MLTHNPPFDVVEGEGDSEYPVKDQHLRLTPKAPTEWNPAIPDHVSRTMMRCLEKNADDRFDCRAEVLAALTQTAAPIRTPIPKLTPPPVAPIVTRRTCLAWRRSLPRR